MSSRRKSAKLAGLTALVVFLSSCQGPAAAPTSQDPASASIVPPQQHGAKAPGPNYRVKAFSIFIDDWLSGNFFMPGLQNSFPILVPAASTNLYYGRVEHFEGAFVYTTKDSEGRWGGLHIPFRSSPLIDPDDVYNPDTPPSEEDPGGGGIIGGDEEDEEPDGSPVPASPLPRKKSKDPADAHPWPDPPRPSFPPPNGLFDLQVQPPFISTTGNSRIKSAILEVTASTTDGLWNLSVGSGAPFLAGVGSRPSLRWSGRINGRPADDGKYTIYLDAPSTGKRDTEDITVDSTSPSIELVILTDIEYLEQKNQSIYTFRVKAKDPMVNASASGVDFTSARITQSTLNYEAFGTPVAISTEEVEFKAKFDEVPGAKHDFQIGVQDAAGNFVNKKCSFDFDFGIVGFENEPFLTSVEPSGAAYKTSATGNGARGNGADNSDNSIVPSQQTNDKAVVPSQQSKDQLARKRRAEVAEAVAEFLYMQERGHDAAEAGDDIVRYLQEELLVPKSLDTVNSPIFWTNGTKNHSYAIGLAVTIGAENIEFKAPLISVPAEVVYKNNREPGHQFWLQDQLRIKARLPLVDKLGKRFAMFGTTVINWNGYRRRTGGELVETGKYSVHCNFGVPGKKKYARLTGFGVLNDKDNMTFNSYKEFTNFFGSAGTGYEWHHLVEQTTYKGLVDESMLQSTFNIVRIHKNNHSNISKFYSRDGYRASLKRRFPTHNFFELRQVGLENMINPTIGNWQLDKQGSYERQDESGNSNEQDNDQESVSERN